MSKKKKVWILTGESESGDSYGPDVFDKEPTEEQIKKWCHECDGDDDEDGPGDFGSYVYYSLEEQEVQK